MHCRLGHAVGGASADVGEAGHAAHVDDARRGVFGQQRIGIAGKLERREQVDLEDLAPLVLGVVDDCATTVAAGVVDQDVEAFAAILDPVEDFASLLLVGDIGDQCMHFAIRDFVGEFVAGALQRRGVARDDQDFSAEAEKFARNCAADAGTATGDQRQLPVESPAIGVHARCLIRFGVA